MLSKLCKELNNWFDRGQPRIRGTIEISNGKIVNDSFVSLIQDNQYFRIVGSVFNDGVYQNTDLLELTDETFTGAIWLMAIPKDVNSAAMSPFNSESFGGYSYTKANGGSDSGSSVPTWQSVFTSQLNVWRKI